jgi:Ca2+-binding RTX toxin-like protein
VKNYAGAGDDTVKVGWGGGSVYVELGDGHDSLYNGSDKRVTAYGQGGNDHIEGGQYDDYLVGGPGDDYIFGGNGKDTLIGNDGNDTLDADSYGTLFAGTVNGGNGVDTARIDPIDQTSSIEKLLPQVL